MSLSPRNADIAQESHCIDDDTNSLLHKFWKDEEIHQSLPLMYEYKQCEQQFGSLHSYMPDSIYKMQSSFSKDSPRVNADSLPIAISYARLESRSRTRPEIRKHYYEFLREYRELKPCDDFLHEYCELNHVELVTEGRVSLFKIVCIQHHAVTRDASIARLRVVLDASGKMRDDTSLGDHLLIGAKLQRVLPFTRIRWRPWRSVHTANISGMLLQILILRCQWMRRARKRSPQKLDNSLYRIWIV